MQDDGGIEVAILTQAALADATERYISPICKRLSLPMSRLPNSRPVILVLGEELSGKSSLISYIADTDLRAASMCLNVFLPGQDTGHKDMDILDLLCPSLAHIFRSTALPVSLLNIQTFASYSASGFGLMTTLRASVSTPATSDGIQLGKSLFYSFVDPAAQGGSVLVETTRDTLGEIPTQHLTSSTCPFIFIEVPYYHSNVRDLTLRGSHAAGLAASSKVGKGGQPFNHAEKKALDAVVAVLLEQADVILVTTSCNAEQGSEGFSGSTLNTLAHISLHDQLFAKTHVVLTKADSIAKKPVYVHAIQECAAQLTILSPYRRFPILTVHIPRYSELRLAEEHNRNARLKHSICQTMQQLEASSVQLVDKTNMVIGVINLGSTLAADPDLELGSSLLGRSTRQLRSSSASANPGSIIVDSGIHTRESPRRRSCSNVCEGSQALRLTGKPSFVANASTSRDAQAMMLTSLQDSGLVASLRNSQQVVIDLAARLMGQCGAALRFMNPDLIGEQPGKSRFQPHNDSEREPQHRAAGYLMSMTDTLMEQLGGSIIQVRDITIVETLRRIELIMQRLRDYTRISRRTNAYNWMIFLSRVILVVGAIVLTFLLLLAGGFFEPDFLQSRCYVHHLARAINHREEVFEGSPLERAICVLFYEGGIFWLRTRIQNIRTTILLCSLVPLLLLVAVLLRYAYKAAPLPHAELQRIALEARAVLSPLQQNLAALKN
ncbi:hypothetical protein GMRT_20795 [Giardia muris]|uniref:Uncharacterized protein n=1 Tax=Giardia muris TaxID=5742 RepID=A0A4Z1TBT1_GIAMU|nr:hypothetical protein GMRT_20795 [Giardia muris]|eukprot:TNJ29989.1 hypothetical protein GMRT_20795 [Giardia muris]